MKHIKVPPRGLIIHSDCLDAMRELPSESFDAVVTSPPYNLRRQADGSIRKNFTGFWESSKLLNEGYQEHDDAMPYGEYVPWQRHCLMEMYRLISPQGVIVYNHKWRIEGGLLNDRRSILEGFPVRQVVIWNRKGGLNFNPGYFLPVFEVLYFIAKPEFKLFPHANKFTDVWEIPPEVGSEHPAPFPVALTDQILLALNGRRVLDPFMGSGTTLVSADKAGWDWVGIDLSEKYCELAVDRLRQSSMELG